MIERDLVIVGDEAYTADEWERLQRRRRWWRADRASAAENRSAAG